MAAKCMAFGDNSDAEFRGISQTAPRNLAKFAAEKRGSWSLVLTSTKITVSIFVMVHLSVTENDHCVCFNELCRCLCGFVFEYRSTAEIALRHQLAAVCQTIFLTSLNKIVG